MVLPCIEARRFEDSMLSCRWLFQQMAAMISRHNSLAQKLEVEIIRMVSVRCHAHR